MHMSKIVGVTFSNNEMFNLSVEYGISALKKNDEFSLYQIDNDNIANSIEQIVSGRTKIIVFFVSYHSYDILAECSQKLKKMLPNCYTIICHQVATN